MWDHLPSDVTRHILWLTSRENAACRVQRAWHGYRTRVLLGRFRMLRYLQAFRVFNPSVGCFLRRARL